MAHNIPLNDYKCSCFRKTAYLKLIYFLCAKFKKKVVKEVFGHLKKKTI